MGGPKSDSGASGKPHKFGRSRKEARALMEEKRSAKNSMLEAMSDVQSMSGLEQQNRDVLIIKNPPKKSEDPQNHNEGSDKDANSQSEMMEFNEDANMD